MRVILSICLLFFLLNTSLAQTCDIAQAGITVYNADGTAAVTAIPSGQTASFRFSIKNLGTVSGCSIPANTITAVFDFPALAGGVKPYIYNGPASFTSGYFSWNYDSDANVLIGTNTVAIPGGEGDMEIAVKVKGNAAGAGSSNLNLTQGRGVSDNTANNFSGAKLAVSTGGLQPVNLASFTATADICDVLLAWKTTSETDFSHFELEYSKDGVNFSKAARIDGSNNPGGSDYHFTYTQLNEEGYYRLKETGRDGSYVYSNTIHVTTVCHGKGKILVYPNPVSYAQKLKINISGYSGKMTGDLYNGTGQKTATYFLTNRTNEVSLEKLSAGSYLLKIRNESGELESFKIIVTR